MNTAITNRLQEEKQNLIKLCREFDGLSFAGKHIENITTSMNDYLFHS